jgi:hypothetical protein
VPYVLPRDGDQRLANRLDVRGQFLAETFSILRDEIGQISGDRSESRRELGADLIAQAGDVIDAEKLFRQPGPAQLTPRIKLLCANNL